jgi:hypothetical protein
LQLRASGLSDESYLSSEGAVLLLGEAGSGKSALAQMLVRRSAKAGLRGGSRTEGRLGFSVPLKDLPLERLGRMSRPDLWTYFVQYFEENYLLQLPLYDCRDLLDQAGRSGGWIIILDGLDEVRSESRTAVESVVSHLASLARSQPAPNLLVVTARQQALYRHQTDFIRQFDEVETLGAFSVSGIFSFLLRYEYRRGDAPGNARRLLGYLQLYPHLLEACRNPLTLNLLVGLDQRNGEAGDPEYNYYLPETRATFFQIVADELLIHRRRTQVGVGQAPNSLRRLREEFFERVAGTHLESRGQSFNRIPKEVLLLALADSGLIPNELSPEDALAELTELAEQTGLIARCGEEHWEFVHRAFLDYFAGRSYSRLRHRNRSDFVRRTARLPERLEEALFFACGLLANYDKPAATQLLEDVRQFNPGAYLRACLEAQIYSEDFVTSIREEISKIDIETEPARCALIDRILRDFARVNRELGRSAPISRATLIRRITAVSLTHQGAVDFLIRCDISMVGELHHEPQFQATSLGYEEIIRGCYEPNLLPFVTANAVAPEPGGFPWAAILAEASLRSSLVSDSLRSEVHTAASVRPVWSSAWPIKGSLYGFVLDSALRERPTAPASFPHLEMLRPVRRPSQTQFGDLSRSLLSSPYATFTLIYASLLSVASAILLLAYGRDHLTTSLVLGGLGLLYFVSFYRRRGRLLVKSLPRLLNLQPSLQRVSLAERIVFGSTPTPPPRFRIGSYTSVKRLESGPGEYRSVYDQIFPFFWITYTPSTGRGWLRQVAAARIQQWDMEQLRELCTVRIRPSDSELK